MKKTLILSCILMLITAPMAIAGPIEQGDMFVSLAGAWQSISFEGSDSHDNDFDDIDDIDIGDFNPEDTDILTVTGGVEYFLSPALSLGIGGMGLWSDFIDLYGIGASCRLNFPGDSNVVPYVGGQYNILKAELDGGSDGDAQLYGPLAGLRIFMNESANFFVEYQYQLFGGDVEDALDDGHSIVFGIAYLWGRE